MLIGWLWRLILLCGLFRRIAGLDLARVPTHPDGAGGIGFLERVPSLFSPIAFGISAVLAIEIPIRELLQGLLKALI